MRTLDKELENKKIEIKNLLIYGFEEKGNNYIYQDKLLDGKFEIIVQIDKDKKMTSKVLETENNEEYFLVDIQDATGEFVGKVREEYENKLQDIIDKCAIPNVYKSNQAKEIIKYIKEKYNDNLEFLWKKFDDNAIWRNKKNNKWYGALLIIEENKIGIDSDKIVEIIDLRYQKELIKDLIDNKKIFPGYHMNKENWITIKLDDSVDIETIFTLIDNSYELSLNK